MRVISILVSAVLLLVACGTRGPLTLPPRMVDNSSKLNEAGR